MQPFSKDHLPGKETDDKSVSGFVGSDKEKEFFELNREIHMNVNLGSHEIMMLVREKWPNDEQVRQEFFDWCKNYYSRYFKSLTKAWTLDDFCNNIAQTDFCDPKSLNTMSAGGPSSFGGPSSSKTPASFCPPGWRTDEDLEKLLKSSKMDKQYAALEQEIRKTTGRSSDDVLELVEKRFGKNDAKVEGYFVWAEKYHSRYFDSLNRAWTLDDFCNGISQSNFCNSKSLAQWVWTMEQAHLPFMPFGQVNWDGYETCFGLLPSSGYIHPHIDHARSRQDELLHRSVIATNDIVIKPTTPDGRGGNQMQPSRSSKPSDAKVLRRLNCRVFAQLGSLYVFDGDWRKAKHSEQDVRKGPWRSTGFGVLLELDPYGKQLGVYIMWNFFGEFTDSLGNTRRHHIKTADAKGERLPHIGFIHEKCNIHTRFVMAKIAHSLADFQSAEKLVTLMSLSDGDPFPKDEIQVVRVKHLSDAEGGRIMLPQFVKD